ncbi:hypothetical protein LVY72_20870 [Arthrobacter sp. I2-34]|uniref:Uncharacterized protein n=1 Tax=Arthrobacter hankyongi TaxID=2904801 RepID=A0ABS9LCU3_9MICC|nr:hypothetical protein [Arthrobacter hankyongi]MCG2624348.1 hypothetical protein [Arthrobacter hankyongi]
MSQDIAAIILIVMAAVLPVAISLLTKWRKRWNRRRMLKASAGIRTQAGYVPRHLSTGHKADGGAPAAAIWSPALADFAPEEAIAGTV